MIRSIQILGIVVLFLFPSCTTLSQPDEAVGRINLKPSKERTVFEGPLLPDGRIDFIAALNEHLSTGVTHENNAFRALFLLMPVFDEDQEIDPDHPSPMAVMADKLEVTKQERDGVTPLVGWYEYAEAKGVSYEDIDDIESLTYDLDFKHPKIEIYKEWLSSQEPGFKQLVVAVNRPKYWRPEIEDADLPGGGQFSFEYMALSRRFLRMLNARAKYALSQGNHQQFIESLASIYRLADHVAQGPFLIDRLVANSIEASAIELLYQALRNQELDADNLAALQGILDNRMPRPSMAEIAAIGEHVFTVNYFIAHATGKDSLGRLYNQYWVNPVDSSALDDAIRKVGVDLDAGLRQIATSTRLDVAAWKSETLKDYVRLEDARNNLWQPRWDLIKEKHIEEDEEGNRRIKVPRDIRNPVALAGLIIDLPYVLMGDFIQHIGSATYTFAARRQVNEVAMALERYRMANGKYPDRLEDLLPKYRRALPIDPIDGEPLRYRLEDDGAAVIYSIYKNMKDDGGSTDVDDYEALEEGDYVRRLELPED